MVSLTTMRSSSPTASDLRLRFVGKLWPALALLELLRDGSASLESLRIRKVLVMRRVVLPKPAFAEPSQPLPPSFARHDGNSLR